MTQMGKQHDTSNIEGILETVEDAGDDPDRVSVDDMLAEIGTDAFPAIIMVPALILISPLSGVPGLSSVGAAIIGLTAAQMVAGRKALWLPAFLRRRTVRRSTLHKALLWLERPAHFVDRHIGRRMTWLTRKPFSLIPALACLLISCVIPFLELLPFSTSIAATAIAFFALGLVAGDGLLVIAGIVVALAAAASVYAMVGS